MKNIFLFLITCVSVTFITNAQDPLFPTKGPAGATINSLVSLNDTVIAGTQQGIYISTDMAESWSKIKTADSLLQNGAVSLIQVYEHTLYAETDNGIYTSSNSGFSWAPFGSPPVQITCFAFNDSGVFAGTAKGIYFSNNQGKTWGLRNQGLGWDLEIIQLTFLGDSMYASTEWDGVYTSANNGLKWGKSGTAIGTARVFNYYSYNSMEYALGDVGFAVSSDKGKNWAFQNLGLPQYPPCRLLIPVGDSLILFTTGEVFISVNTSLSWSLVNAKPFSSAIKLNDDQVLAATDGIFLTSDHGRTFTTKNVGFLNKNVLSLASIGNTLFAACGNDGFYTTNDQGDTWNRLPNPIGFYNASIKGYGDTLLMGYNTNLEYSTDGGKTRVAFNVGNIFLGYVIKIATTGNAIFVSTQKGSGVVYSPDRGKTWAVFNKNQENANVTDITLDDENMYALTSDGIHTSSVQTPNWIKIPQPLNTVGTVMAILHDTLYVGGSKGIRAFDVNSQSWTDTLFRGNVSKLVVINGELLVGSGNTVFKKDPASAHFNSYFTAGKTSFNINDLYADQGYLYVATNRAAVWKGVLNDVVTGTAIQGSLDTHAEFTFFPNPSKGNLTIQHPQEGNQKLEIFNFAGKLLWQSEGPLQANAEVLLKPLPSGIYLLKLTNNSKNYFTRMIVD